MTLLFYVNNQTLSLGPNQTNKTVVADSRNYLKVKFVFQTQDWNNQAPLCALFSYNGKTYKKILGLEDGVGGTECFVPNEVIKVEGFSVSVCGGDLITTNAVNIPVITSGYTDTIQNSVQPTADFAAQINELMYKYAMACNEILKECQVIKEDIQEEKGE